MRRQQIKERNRRLRERRDRSRQARNLRDSIIFAVRAALFPTKHPDSTKTKRAKEQAKARKYWRTL